MNYVLVYVLNKEKWNLSVYCCQDEHFSQVTFARGQNNQQTAVREKVMTDITFKNMNKTQNGFNYFTV